MGAESRSWGFWAAGALLGAALCGGCSGGEGPGSPGEPVRKADLKVDPRLVAGVNDLGFRLYGKLSAADVSKNVFISPASVEMALAMTLNGARGATRDKMAGVLGVARLKPEEANAANAQLMSLLRNPDGKVELTIANSLWGRAGVTFDPAFIEANRTSFDAEVQTVDFADARSADTINGWVDGKTRGKIARLVDHDAIKEALMVLVNALYFKGKWTLPFDPKETQDGPFTLADGKKVDVALMRHAGKYAYLETDQIQAVALPYGEKYVQAVVVLPRAGTSQEDFAKLLTAENWDKWAGQLAEREGTVILPRFNSAYGTSLRASLSALGMADAFTDAADLTGMVTPEALASLGGRPFISDVVHKTALEVNEEGTEAAAATGVVVGVTSAPADPFTMQIDRPFFLVIRDAPTGVILFMGMIRDPR